MPPGRPSVIPLTPVAALTRWIRAMRLIGGSIVHRIHRVTPINHVVPVSLVTGDAAVAVATDLRN